MKTYTSNPVNKWGIVDSGSRIEYERVPNRSGLVLLVGLLVVILLAMFIASKAHALSDGGSLGFTPVEAGTGECGYFRNQGEDHRNGLVTPSYCDKGNETVNPTVEKQDKTSTSLTVEIPSTSHPTVTHNTHPVVVPSTGGNGNSGGDNTPKVKKAHSDNGNHYGNDKGDNNCKDQKNSHNTCH